MNEDNLPLPETLVGWIEETVGDCHAVSRFAHDHGYSQLWRLQCQSTDRKGSYLWLKCHRFPGKWAGEVHALVRWTEPGALSAPRLVGSREDPPAVLLTEVGGTPADTLGLEERAEQRLWFSAGEWLRSLHQIRNDWFGAARPDGTPQGERQHNATEFVRRSIETRRVQGKETGLFDTGELQFIEHAAKHWPEALNEEAPHAVHRDFGPRNWMTDADGTLQGVIDFEHARWDVRAADLYRWWDAEFLTRPYLEAPFFDGYLGGPADEALHGQIRALRLLGAVAGVIWATQVGDLPYAAANRRALHRLQEMKG